MKVLIVLVISGIFAKLCFSLEKRLDPRFRKGDCIVLKGSNEIFTKIVRVDGEDYTLESVKNGQAFLHTIKIPTHLKHNYKKVDCY